MMNPESAVIISGPIVASDAIAGRPHAIASSKTNPNPSAKDGNTNTSDSRYRSRNACEEHGGNHLMPGGKDRRLPSARNQKPTSASSASRKSAFDQASISNGMPFRRETWQAYINSSGHDGLLI